MSRSIPVLFLAVATCASTVLASAQVTSSPTGRGTPATSSSTVAYVYVSSTTSSTTGEIHAYSAASNGKLTAVTGSPFSADVHYMAVNGKYLFGTNGIEIFTYAISPDGALKKVATTASGTIGGGPANLFLDHTGATLYDGDVNANGADNNAYQSWHILTSGGLNFLNLSPPNGGPSFGDVLSFIGNNEVAYTASCYQGDALILGFKRDSTGALTQLNITPRIPAATGNDYYCPFLAAADTRNHLAVSLTPMSFLTVAGKTQFAVYTANSSGALTTNSTSSNMPATAVATVTDFWMAPSGRLLAVAGTGGLQVFHFNGASPITHYTGLLTTVEIDQVFWDNANHLYALSRSAGELYVFTVTPTTAAAAPGSPYSIEKAVNLIVQPK